MRSRVCGGASFVACLLTFAGLACAADEKVEVLKEAPRGLSPEVTSAIADTGLRVSGKDGVICDVWLSKEIALKPQFKSSLRIRYPFQVGQLVGVIRLPEGSKPTDFRGQELATGTYTLRYGLQPDDGNHLGTSETRDFLVGCNPREDKSPKAVEDIKELFKLSANAAGTTHPAIFLLISPPEKPFSAPSVAHEEEKSLLILQANVNGKDNGKATPVPTSIVVRGKGEA